MAATVRWDVLRPQIRQCADIESATLRFPDAELLVYANASAQELYDLLIASGSDFNLKSGTPFNTASGTDLYALATDFYQLRGLDVAVGGPAPLSLKRFTFEERNVDASRTPGWPTAYRLSGAYVRLWPIPQGVYAVTPWYYPVLTLMTVDASTIDFIHGWEEYVVVDAAMKCLRKDDRDVSVLMAQKVAIRDRIIGMAANRDAAAPERVGDVDNVPDGWW